MATDLRRTLASVAFATVAMAAGLAGAQEPDAKALVTQVIEAIPNSSLSARMMLSATGAPPRELRLYRKRIDGGNASYLEVASPDELTGIRFLFIERLDQPNEQYIKVKISRSPVQVQDDVRTQPFLGSAFYVSDLVLPNIDDFDYRYLGKDVVGGRAVTLVEMTPRRPAEQVYAKTILALDPKDKLIMRREFFDAKGARVKVWTIDKVEQIDGFWMLTGQQMENLQDNTVARLDISEITYGADLPDSMFTPKYLSH